MQNELTSQSLAEFRKKFGTLHDAVIHHIHYEMFSAAPRHQAPDRVVLTLGTRDHSEEKRSVGEENWPQGLPVNGEIWVNLTLTFEDIIQVYIKQERRYELGIIPELSIDFFGNEVYVGLMHIDANHTPESYADSPKAHTLLNISSKKCFWSIAPYQTREN